MTILGMNSSNEYCSKVFNNILFDLNSRLKGKDVFSPYLSLHPPLTVCFYSQLVFLFQCAQASYR